MSPVDFQYKQDEEANLLTSLRFGLLSLAGFLFEVPVCLYVSIVRHI